jgi:hypothetical protein
MLLCTLHCIWGFKMFNYLFWSDGTWKCGSKRERMWFVFLIKLKSVFLVVKNPTADATDALQPWGLLRDPMKMKMTMIIFCPFPSNRAPVEWNWQGTTKNSGEKPVRMPLCSPQIPHGLTRDRTRAKIRLSNLRKSAIVFICPLSVFSGWY